MTQKKEGIIAQISHEIFRDKPAAILEFHNGLLVVLTSDSLACYKNRQSANDPFGNGLRDVAKIASDNSIKFQDNRCVREYKSGYVGLLDGKALIIAPQVVRLFSNNHDALRGINCLAELTLPDIDLH